MAMIERTNQGTAHSTRRASAREGKAALTLVPVAWPTLALTAVALGGWLWALLAALSGVTPWITLPVATWCAFAAFTPMHDAAHRAVTRRRWPNELVGRLCSVILTAPFPAFRCVHLTHHKHTNEPGLDPDLWSGQGPRWALPLRWLTQDLHYYVVYLRVGRPRREVWETLGSVAAIYGLAAALIATGHGQAALLCWLIPARLAIGLLACTFDYLPHRPHTITGKADRYQATSVRPTPWLTPILLWQNYHLIHHLYPAVPFYRYGRVWRAQREKLIARGAKVITR